MHDGSENSEDSFVVIAKAGDKESFATSVRVVIILVNDELPQIVNNTGLTLWQGGSHLITPIHLGMQIPRLCKVI